MVISLSTHQRGSRMPSIDIATRRAAISSVNAPSDSSLSGVRSAGRMIEFFFDCSSPFTYLAFHNFQPLAREFGVGIVWKPILVGAVFNAINPSVYARRDNPI